MSFTATALASAVAGTSGCSASSLGLFSSNLIRKGDFRFGSSDSEIFWAGNNKSTSGLAPRGDLFHLLLVDGELLSLDAVCFERGVGGVDDASCSAVEDFSASLSEVLGTWLLVSVVLEVGMGIAPDEMNALGGLLAVPFGVGDGRGGNAMGFVDDNRVVPAELIKLCLSSFGEESSVIGTDG